MTTTDRVPPPTITVENPAFTEAVERRASTLCAGAEPHRGAYWCAGGVSCLTHLNEARRQLMDRWLGQENGAS